MSTLKLQSPWVTHYEKIRELFKNDKEIKLVWDDDSANLTMYIDNPNKANVLRSMIPQTKTFGNVTMTIDIIPSNSCNFVAHTNPYIEHAFAGNPIYHFSKTFPNAFMTNPITYVVFAKEVIQYYNDDLGDLFGNANCLAEDLARDVLENNVDGIFFCTDIE